MKKLCLGLISAFMISSMGCSGTTGKVDGGIYNGLDVPLNVRTELNNTLLSKKYPFNLYVIMGKFESRVQFDVTVSNCVRLRGPDWVCIGVDPIRRETLVYFGASTGVKPADYNSIIGAGTPYFKNHLLIDGIVAIADFARMSSNKSVVE